VRATCCYLTLLLSFEQISDTHSNGANGLSDARSEDSPSADRRDRREGPCSDEDSTQCGHGSRVLCTQEIEGVARIKEPCWCVRYSCDSWIDGFQRILRRISTCHSLPSADGVDKAVTALSEVNTGLEANAWLEVTVWLDETVVVVNVEAMEFARVGVLRDLIAAAATSAESESIFIGFGRLDGKGGGSSTISEEVTSFCDPSLSFKDFLLVSHNMPDGLEWS